MDAGAAPLLRMEGITKHYGGVRALEDVRFECHAGRIHAVLGENGAGKSTLIKIMSGVVQPDAGVIEFEGAPVTFPDPACRQQRPASPAFSRSCRCCPILRSPTISASPIRPSGAG